MTDIQTKVGEAATAGGSVTAVAAGLSLNEVGVIIGIITAIVGILIQVFFSRRRDHREREFHTARMKELKDD